MGRGPNAAPPRSEQARDRQNTNSPELCEGRRGRRSPVVASRATAATLPRISVGSANRRSPSRIAALTPRLSLALSTTDRPATGNR